MTVRAHTLTYIAYRTKVYTGSASDFDRSMALSMAMTMTQQLARNWMGSLELIHRPL